jgi:hypothetical protein
MCFQKLKKMMVIGPAYLVKVHLCEHEVSCQYHRLEGMKSSVLDCDDEVASATGVFDQAKALDQSLVVESTVMDSSEQAVSVEVIKLVCVNFAGEDFL